VDDFPVVGDLVPNSCVDVCDGSVDAIVDVCPPPPPRELPPMESRAVTQLIECQNSTIAVLSASLQSLCVKSSGDGGGFSVGQADFNEIFGRCQVYIQDNIGKTAIKIGNDLEAKMKANNSQLKEHMVAVFKEQHN